MLYIFLIPIIGLVVAFLSIKFSLKHSLEGTMLCHFSFFQLVD